MRPFAGIRLTPFDARLPPLAQGRITCPSVPLSARGSGPAAAEYAASRRKPCPLRVHARRYLL